MSRLTALKEYLPWIQTPFIINAPMSGIAKSKLATAVTKAGGLGQIGYLDNLHELANELETAKQSFLEAKFDISKTLPIGLGVIVFGSPLRAWLTLFAKYKPAVAWLSFADTDELQEWTEGIRGCSPETRVWVQLGSVRAAVDVARACRPDALVLQGVDAGGHGHENGASIVSLIPEVADALSDLGIDDLPLIAAGGIVDGRGCASAFALGASGVVMGTRFLAAKEASVPAIYRDAIFEASDGGEMTARSRVFDEIWGSNLWPKTYDGRCLKNRVYEQHRSGVDMNKIRAWLSSAMNGPAAEKLETKDMGSIWAGTGVGLVKKQDNAEVIVQEVRSNTRSHLERAYLHMGLMD
jgi:nitronate monooxygenase